MPISGTILGLGGLALVGSPPFNIFMSEFMVLWAAFEKMSVSSPGERLLLGLSIGLFLLTVTLIFGGLVGHLARLLLGRPPFPVVEPAPERWRWLWPFIGLLAIITIFGILIPGLLVDLPHLLEESVRVISPTLAGQGSGIP